MKKRRIDVASPVDSAFADTATKELALSKDVFDEFDSVINRRAKKSTEEKHLWWMPRRLDTPGLVNFALKQFEKEAKDFLKKKGLPAEKNSGTMNLYNDRKDSLDVEDVEINNAINMLFLPQRVWDEIKLGFADCAVLDVLRLCFAAISLNLHEAVIRGIRAKAAPGKGGKAPKAPEGIFEAIRVNLEEKNLKARELWRFFRENYSEGLPFESSSGTQVYFYSPVKGHTGQIVEDCEKYQKKVSFERFRKHMSMVKKQMKKK